LSLTSEIIAALAFPSDIMARKSLQRSTLWLLALSTALPAAAFSATNVGSTLTRSCRGGSPVVWRPRKIAARQSLARVFMQQGGAEGEQEALSERSAMGLSDLSLLGAFGKLRAGLPTKTRELPKPSRINECFEIQVNCACA